MFQSRYRRKSGAALVEASLFLIVLFMLLGGVVDGGRYFATTVGLNNAAREGARYAAGNPTDSTGIATAVLNELITGSLVPRNSVLGTATLSGGVTSVPVNVTLQQQETVTLSIPGKQITGGAAGSTVTNIARVTIREQTESTSTAGRAMVVGVSYGYRPILGALIGFNSKTIYTEAQMIRIP